MHRQNEMKPSVDKDQNTMINFTQSKKKKKYSSLNEKITRTIFKKKRLLFSLIKPALF